MLRYLEIITVATLHNDCGRKSVHFLNLITLYELRSGRISAITSALRSNWTEI
jgi:hypothetical protein